MTETLLNLSQFVEHFNLKDATGAIRFKANIVFKIDNTVIIKFCEAHIITSNNLCAIYFLYGNMTNEILPDMIDIKITGCIYAINECLRIDTGVYTISVFPLAGIV